MSMNRDCREHITVIPGTKCCEECAGDGSCTQVIKDGGGDDIEHCHRCGTWIFEDDGYQCDFCGETFCYGYQEENFTEIAPGIGSGISSVKACFDCADNISPEQRQGCIDDFNMEK